VRIRRWAALLSVVGCACAVGRGCACADPERRAGSAERPAASEARAPSAAPDPPRVEAGGKVVRVRDGDSIVVLRGGVGIEVRLDGVDCPELAQAFGRKAKSFTSAAAFGKGVRLVGKGKDRYGRELAEVFLPDGRSLNRELVLAGYAWWYRKYSNDRSLETLEQAARTARRGLWVDANPVPPWDFRESRRVNPGGRN
jgi:endonuclease YncB( thermonuclease family)